MLILNNVLLVETILADGAADSKIIKLHIIHCMIHQTWKVYIHHISRAQNTDADYMTKFKATIFHKNPSEVFEESSHPV